MEDNKFTDLIKPFLNSIDDGSFFRKPLKWLYIVMSIINLVFPIYILYQAIDSGFFEYTDGKVTFFFILIWLVILAAGWFSFQLWWNRKDKVDTTTDKDDEFTATPAFAHLIQTTGEWVGSWIAVVGFFISLFLTLAFGSEASYLSRAMGVGFISVGYISAILMPIYGFVIIIFSRFMAEQFKALTTIANNTRKSKPAPETQEIEEIQEY